MAREEKNQSSFHHHLKKETSSVVDDDPELIPLNEEMSLFLKDVNKITLTVQLPKVKLPGQCISTSEVMERLKKKAKPHSFKSLSVINDTIDFIRFEAEFESKIVMDLVMSKLNHLLLKTSAFTDGLKVKCAKLKIGSSKHEWESYFRDNSNMDEKKPGYRPDTIHIKNLPLKWFGGTRPSSSMLLDAFKSFGEIKRFHIPLVDEMELKAMNNTFQKFSHSDSIAFEAFIMYKDYVGFVKAMESLKGKKLVVKRGHHPPMDFNITVDFDKTKHLSDKAIKKRKLAKEYQIQNSDEVKQLKEETKKQREAYELRVSQLIHRKKQAKCLLELILRKVSEREEKREEERKQKLAEQQQQQERERKQRLQEELDRKLKEVEEEEQQEEKNRRKSQEDEKQETTKEKELNEGEVTKSKEIVSGKEDRVSEEQKVASSPYSSIAVSNPSVVSKQSSESIQRKRISAPMRSLVSTVRIPETSDLEDCGTDRNDSDKSSGLRSIIHSKQGHDEESHENLGRSHEDYHSRHSSHYGNGDGRRRIVDRLPPGVYEYRPARDRMYSDDDRHNGDNMRREEQRRRDYYRNERRASDYYNDNRSSLREAFQRETDRHPHRQDRSRSRGEIKRKASEDKIGHDSPSPSISSSTSSSVRLEKESLKQEDTVSKVKPDERKESVRQSKRARITFDSFSDVKQHKTVSSVNSKPRLLITTTNDLALQKSNEEPTPGARRQRILVKVDQHL